MSDELPAAAEARMAEIRASGTWGSALTSDEFAAIRSVGFEPAALSPRAQDILLARMVPFVERNYNGASA